MANEITVELVQIGASTTEAHLRQHKVLVDRPEAKGGGDRGPMGGELFLAAVGGCFMSNLLAAIRTRGVAIPPMRVHVVGTLAEAPPRFQDVHLRVTTDCNDVELIDKLVDIADRGCIMTNTLRAIITVSVSVAHRDTVDATS